MFTPLFGSVNRSFLLIETKDEDGNVHRLIYPFALQQVELRQDYEANFSIWDSYAHIHPLPGTHITIEGYLNDGMEYKHPVPDDPKEIAQSLAITNGEEEVVEAEIVEDDDEKSDGIGDDFEDWYDPDGYDS